MRHNEDPLLIGEYGFTADLFGDSRAWFLISNPIVKLLETSEIVAGMFGVEFLHFQLPAPWYESVQKTRDLTATFLSIQR